MASAREVRLRIRSVKNIAKVTKALEAVSASLVRSAQQTVLATRAYAGRAFEILNHLATQPGDISKLHPLLEQREVKTAAIVLITSDRGLAGPYNMNVVRAALDKLDESTVPVKWISVGKKGRDLVYRSRGELIAFFENYSRPPRLLDTLPISRTVIDGFLDGSFDEVWLAYTDYVNTVTLVPEVRRLLPLGLTAEEQAMAEYITGAENGEAPREYIYEPGARELLNSILPQFTELQVFQAILEALASEHSARMVAMRNATDNATELGNSLRLAYNKARQLAITSDMLDIAGGAEALSNGNGNNNNRNNRKNNSRASASKSGVAATNGGNKNGSH